MWSWFRFLLDDAEILDYFQCGFHPAILDTLTEDMQKHLDQSGLVLLLLLNLTVAFDMINHDLLTHCLANMGIQRTALHGFPPSFTVRERVALGEDLSLWHSLDVVCYRERSYPATI